MAQQFLTAHGAEAFDLAMRCGPMFTGLRASSRWAVNSAIGAYEAGVPTVLLTRLHSNAKRTVERVEHRLISGDAALVVDFPPL